MSQLQQQLSQLHMPGQGQMPLSANPLPMRPQDPYPQMDFQTGVPGMLPPPLYQGILPCQGPLGNMYYPPGP